MTKKEQLKTLLNKLVDEAGVNEVAMSEAVEESKSLDAKINEIHEFLFADLEDEAVEEPNEVAMSAAEAAIPEADAALQAISDANEAEAKVEAQEAKEEAVEAKSEAEEVDWKAQFEAQQKEIEEMKALLTKKEEMKEPALVHDPESKPERDDIQLFGMPGVKPTFQSPQDIVFAALKG